MATRPKAQLNKAAAKVAPISKERLLSILFNEIKQESLHHRLMDDAAEIGDMPFIMAMVNRGIKIDKGSKTSNDTTLLHKVAVVGRTNMIDPLLALGIYINASDGAGYDSVHLSAQHNRVTFLRKLIERGARVNGRTFHDSEPTHIAARYGNVTILKILLANGGNINALNNKGHTPLDDAINNHREKAVIFLREKGGKTAKELEAEPAPASTPG